jgi:metal-sulfur cluster biosynthetic enzyme
MVATASYSGVESSTRRTPTSPACLAAATVTSKIRSGRAEAASLARMSTKTVWLKPG